MPVTVVVGTQWGDEGKAKVIDLLAADHAYVVRYQGGHNAGHTVVVGTERYALQLIPSGVLYSSVIPVIGNGVVVDLPTLFKEIDTLEARGVSCERLKVSSRAQLIFPWHQALDAVFENSLGGAKIGTTLKGIGPAYADKARRVGIRVGDILDAETFRSAVRMRALDAQREITSLGGMSLDVEAIVEQFSVLAERLVPYVADTVNLLHDAKDRGDGILLEGAQATFLDVDHGTYPFVTSSNPTAGGASVGSGLGPRDIGRVVGIAKAYTTRVGSGPFPTELFDADGEALRKIGGEVGVTTGRNRRCGWFDAPIARYAVRVNGLTDLDTFDEVKVCVNYTIDGAPVRGYPDRSDLLDQVEPVYETLPGWKTSLAGVTSFSDLPPSAQALINIVERETGVPVSLVGTGPKRDEVVVRA
ncbi:MAG: adenylosuccinate synthase [Actinobacteria bacterium]|nr:adenylosuccinate synthase [Actinomycetota bacterium]